MRSLFAKIFLSFFLTIVLLSALLIFTTVTGELRRAVGLVHQIAERGALDAADAYERGGADAVPPVLERMPLDAALLDDRGRPVAPMSPAARPTADAAGRLIAQSTEPLAEFAASRDVALQPVTTASGHRYVLATRIPHERWLAALNTLDQYPALRLTMVASVAGVICFLLARHITTPLVRLRRTASEMAGGRLDARAGPPIAKRHDEIGALGRDFNRMADRISALLASERQLLADVSHEMQSPLARLTVALGLARRHVPAGAATTEHLDRIEREVEKLDRVIGQSLTLARIESGVDAGPREAVDLTALVQEVVADGDFEARARGRRVRGVAADACSLTGSADLLRSAVENVVRNAIRHTAEGSEVDVELRRVDGAAGARSLVRVRDRGPGIPDALLTEVFLPFRRVDAGDRAPHGAGLGLAIADRVVRSHGGTIHAVNAPDGGLVVEIQLPIS